MLSSGEVPGLFSNEELETLWPMRERMMDEDEVNPRLFHSTNTPIYPSLRGNGPD